MKLLYGQDDEYNGLQLPDHLMSVVEQEIGSGSGSDASISVMYADKSDHQG